MRILPFILLFMIILITNGCTLLVPSTPVDVTPSIAHMTYGAVMDERSFGDIASDKDLALRIKQELMHLKAKEGFFMSVYVYHGRVFLVGDPPEEFKEMAVRFALREEGIASLDYCFFPLNSGNTFSDFSAATALRTNLILESGVISSQIDTAVYANQVVLLGVVEDEKEAELIVALANNTTGINKVISFLLITDEPYTPPPEAEIRPEL